MKIPIKVLPNSRLFRFLIFATGSILLGIGLSAFSHYRYWYGTIKAFQTTQLNLLSHSLPAKLSLLLDSDNSTEVQKTLDSTYGFIGLVITDCLHREAICTSETILYQSSVDRGWEKNFDPVNLSEHSFDILTSPPPLNTENFYAHPYSRVLKQTGSFNPGKIIGRVYYIRSLPPNLFVGLKSWLQNLITLDITSGLLHPYTIFFSLSGLFGFLSWNFIEREIKRTKTFANLRQRQLTSLLQNLEEENLQLTNDNQQLNQQVFNLQNNNDVLKSMIQEQQLLVDKKQAIINQSQADLKVYEKRLKELNNTELERLKLEKQIREQQEKIKAQRLEYQSYLEDLEKTKKELAKNQDRQQRLNILLTESQAKNSDLTEQRQKLQQEIEKLNNNSLDSTDLQEFYTELENSWDRVRELEADNLELINQINLLETTTEQLRLALIEAQKPEELLVKTEETESIKWEIICTPRFQEFWQNDLTEMQQIKVAIYLNYLEGQKTNLKYPYSTKVKNSSLRELRPINNSIEAIRILYRFTPQQEPILLLGDNKVGNNHWYEKYKDIAETEYQSYLKNNQAIPFSNLWSQMSEWAQKQSIQGFMQI